MSYIYKHAKDCKHGQVTNARASIVGICSCGASANYKEYLSVLKRMETAEESV